MMLVLGVITPAALLGLTILYMKEPKKPDPAEGIDVISNNINNTLDEWEEKEGNANGPTYTLIMGFVLETVLACILQLTGINAVMYYGPQIISLSGEFFAENQNLLNIGIGFFNFLFTIAAAGLVERLGRRPLMIFGTATMSLALFALGVVFIPKLNEKIISNPINLGIAVGICLISFIFGFEIGPGCLFWVLVNENFPKEHSKYKETAATYANVLQWVLNLLVSLVFPITIKNNAMETFLFFGGVGILATVYLVIFMKETRN